MLRREQAVRQEGGWERRFRRGVAELGRSKLFRKLCPSTPCAGWLGHFLRAPSDGRLTSFSPLHHLRYSAPLALSLSSPFATLSMAIRLLGGLLLLCLASVISADQTIVVDGQDASIQCAQPSTCKACHADSLLCFQQLRDGHRAC